MPRGVQARIRRASQSIVVKKRSLREHSAIAVDLLIKASTSGPDADVRQAAMDALDALTKLGDASAIGPILLIRKSIWIYKYLSTGVSYDDNGLPQSNGTTSTN